MSKARYHSTLHKGFVSFSAEIIEKRNSARQIIEETRVCDFLADYFDHINKDVLARASQPFSIGVEMDETNANNDVRLSLQTWKYLRRVADPPALDFVQSALEKL